MLQLIDRCIICQIFHKNITCYEMLVVFYGLFTLAICAKISCRISWQFQIARVNYWRFCSVLNQPPVVYMGDLKGNREQAAPPTTYRSLTDHVFTVQLVHDYPAETAPPTSSSPLLPDNTLTAYFVTSPTLIATFSGITSPKCALRRQFVGPVCGHTWVPGCITENFT